MFCSINAQSIRGQRSGPGIQKEEDVASQLVTVPVNIKVNGRLPSSPLGPQNFAIYDGQSAQSVADFASPNDPWTILLLLSVKDIGKKDLTWFQSEVSKFITKGLRSQDRVLIACLSDSIIPIGQGFTSDRRKLALAVGSIPSGKGQQALHEGLKGAIDTLNGVEGRRAIVMVSDGLDTFSPSVNAETALDFAAKAGVLIYALHYRRDNQGSCGTIHDLVFGKPNTPTSVRERMQQMRHPVNYDLGEQILRTLSEDSGTKFKPNTALCNLESAFSDTAKELVSQYTISFVPANPPRTNEEQRSIRVMVNVPNAQVTSRSNYRAFPSLQPVRRGIAKAPYDDESGSRNEPSARGFKVVRHNYYTANIPEQWLESPYGLGRAFAPDSAHKLYQGKNDYSYGLLVDITSDSPRGGLSDQFESYMRRAYSGVQRNSRNTQEALSGRNALSTSVSYLSPVTGQRERADLHAATLRDGRLMVVKFIAPESQFQASQRLFDSILQSIRFAD